MSQSVFGAPGVVSILNRAFTNTSPGNLDFQSQIAAAGTTRESQVLFAAEFGNGFASLVNDSEVLTDTIITNMGLSGVEAEFLAALRAEVIALFESVPASVRGVVVLLLSEVLSSVEGATGDLALMSPVAAAWNTEVAKSFQYSNDTNNTNPGDPLEEPVDTAAPEVAAGQAFEYAENQEAGAVVATVAATDDVAVTAFEIVSGNDEGYFAIDAEGKITLTDAGAAAANDFESGNNSFALGVVAKDAAGNASTATTVALNVTDVDETPPDTAAPEVAADQAFEYAENQVAGAVVATVAATDDVAVTAFEIVSGNDEGYFAIDAEGKITLTEAGAAAANDFESGNNSFALGVVATDAAGNASAATTVALNVTNVEENASSTFTLTAAAPSVAEGTAAEFTLTAGPAADVDQTFSVVITGDDKDGTVGITKADAADFAADVVQTVVLPAGQTSVTFSITPKADNVAEGFQGFKVSLLDGNFADVARATVVITDTTTDVDAPVVAADQTFTYEENQAADAVVATVAATDAVGVTSFEITSGNDAGFFAIDAEGKITLTEAGLAGTANDFDDTGTDAANTFTLGVVAKDAAGNASAATNVTVNVGNVDDTAPALVAATVAGNTVKLNFNEPLAAAVLANPAALFTVTQGATSFTVSSAAIEGSSVVLTLAAAVAATGEIKVSYAGTVLQDAAGNKVAAIVDQVAGTDVVAPTLVDSTPVDDGTAVAVDSNIVLNFSEAVKVGTGSITITNTGDAADVLTIDVTNADQVTVSADGKTVTVNPTDNLKPGATYSVTIANTAFTDEAGNAYAGIADAAELNFTTATSSTTNPGQTFALTEGVDNYQGTDGDDTIIAGEGSSGAIHTLGSSDVINGGAGVDTLSLRLAGGPVATAAVQSVTPNISNVEVFNIQALGADGGAAGIVGVGGANDGENAVNLINATGYTQLWSSNSTNDLALTNVGTKAVIGVSQGTGADYEVQYATTAVTGAQDIVLDTARVGTLAIDNTTNAAAATAGFATVNIDAKAGTSTVNALRSGGANTTTTLNITGAGSVGITTALNAGLKTIDASGNLGGTTLDVTGSTQTITYTGGAGNDSISFGVTLGINDKVDGGTGRDTLGVDSQDQIVTGLKVSNVEVLALNTLDDTLDVTLVPGVNEVRVAAAAGVGTGLADVAGTAIVNGLTSDSTFVTNDSGDVQLNITNAQVAGTNDTLNLKTGIGGIAGTVAVMAAGVENIVYTQNNLAAANATTAVTFYDTDGVVDVTKLTINNTAGNTAVFNDLVNTIKTVDASAAQGKVEISVEAGNRTNGVVITGGAAADKLQGGDGADRLTGGTGSDEFVLSTNDNAANPLNVLVDTITDFTAGRGQDVLNLSALGIAAQGDNSATLVSALNAALPRSTNTGGQAELLILDSTVADLRAANSKEVNDKLFNLNAGDYAGQKVLVAYAATAGGDVRLAVATFNATGADFTVTDVAVLQGVSTASLATNFHADNLTGLGAVKTLAPVAGVITVNGATSGLTQNPDFVKFNPTVPTSIGIADQANATTLANNTAAKNAGADTIQLTAVPTANVTITGFTVGTGADADTLQMAGYANQAALVNDIASITVTESNSAFNASFINKQFLNFAVSLKGADGIAGNADDVTITFNDLIAFDALAPAVSALLTDAGSPAGFATPGFQAGTTEDFTTATNIATIVGTIAGNLEFLG